MRTVRQLLEGKKPGVITIDAGEPVRTAIQLMADHFIGALPVLEGGRLAGIISERDYARKVVLMGRKSSETTVGTIMSTPVIHVGPTQFVGEVDIGRGARRVQQRGVQVAGHQHIGDGHDAAVPRGAVARPSEPVAPRVYLGWIRPTQRYGRSFTTSTGTPRCSASSST